VYGVLRTALNAAVNADLLVRSPARGIKLPQVPKTDVVTLRPADLHRLAVELPDRWQPMVYVAGAAACASPRWLVCGSDASIPRAFDCTCSRLLRRSAASARNPNGGRTPHGARA
jgi:hypothetical protein